MIGVDEVFDEIVVAEGAQYAQIVTPDGALNRTKLNSLITMLNAGLDDIFKRFMVCNTTIIVRTREAQRDYLLDPEFNMSVNSDGYIDDTQEGYSFDAPVIAITGLRTERGVELRLNQRDRMLVEREAPPAGLQPVGSAYKGNYNFLTPKYNLLRCPQSLGASTLYVDLRTGHKRIPFIPDNELDTFDLSTLVIDLPYTYRTALVYYMMSRLFNSKGALTVGRTMFHEGNNYYDKFIRECDSLRVSDSEVTEQVDSINGIIQKGFI